MMRVGIRTETTGERFRKSVEAGNLTYGRECWMRRLWHRQKR